MDADKPNAEQTWNENDSLTFIDYGKFFVPDREQQMHSICEMIPCFEGDFQVLDLGCGEGLLCEAILERFPYSRVTGLDASPEMLRQARKRNQRFGERFQADQCELESEAWRTPGYPVHAVVSSLCIHHLDGEAKQVLFRDLHRLLEPGGALVIADIVRPASRQAADLAANTWEEAVRQRSLEMAENTAPFDLFTREGWNIFREPDDPVDKPSPLLDQLLWLQRAGFDHVDVYWMKAGHAIFGGEKNTP